MDIKNFFQLKIFIIIIIILGAFLALLFAFKLGSMVGARRAWFSCGWDNNYARNFGGPPPRGGFGKMIDDEDFFHANGITGKILKINNQEIVINDRDGAEKIIVVTDKTIIRQARGEIKISDLKTGDDIVVIGEPNSTGQIEAKLIRIFPPLSQVNR